MIYVVKEQIYRNAQTGNISQIRQEMSDGSIQWERPGNPGVFLDPIETAATATSKAAKQREMDKASMTG